MVETDSSSDERRTQAMGANILMEQYTACAEINRPVREFITKYEVADQNYRSTEMRKYVTIYDDELELPQESLYRVKLRTPSSYSSAVYELGNGMHKALKMTKPFPDREFTVFRTSKDSFTFTCKLTKQ